MIKGVVSAAQDLPENAEKVSLRNEEMWGRWKRKKQKE